MNKEKARFNRPIIGVEGGGYMLLSRAEMKVAFGKAKIVNGLVRFLSEDSNPGYNARPGFFKWSGRQSGGGATVLQASIRTKKPKKPKPE